MRGGVDEDVSEIDGGEMMNKKDFIEQLNKIDSVRTTIGSDTQKFYGWQSTVISFLEASGICVGRNQGMKRASCS